MFLQEDTEEGTQCLYSLYYSSSSIFQALCGFMMLVCCSWGSRLVEVHLCVWRIPFKLLFSKALSIRYLHSFSGKQSEGRIGS